VGSPSAALGTPTAGPSFEKVPNEEQGRFVRRESIHGNPIFWGPKGQPP
jgi:hypothetical protein